MWDPDVYLAFADHRGRPFYDLLSRVGAERARRVVDLGCGPGHLTTYLGRRWPDAVIEAMDSSPEMVAAAKERGIDAVTGDLRDWKPQPDTDVVVSNAALHWVPEHADLLLRWAGELAPGSWIGVQMPGNFESPSYAAVRALARREPYAKLLRDIPFRVGAVVQPPAHYANLLLDAGCRVDVWENHVSASADRRASGAGVDHRHGAGPGARTARRRHLAAVPRGVDSAAVRRLSGALRRFDDLPVPAGLRRRRGGRRGPRVAGRHHRTSRDYRCAGLPSSMPRSAAMADRGVGLAP